MPTYIYWCRVCDCKYEVANVSVLDTSCPLCPTCKKRTKRIPSWGGATIFKGTGFYKNDYGKEKGKGLGND